MKHLRGSCARVCRSAAPGLLMFEYGCVLYGRITSMRSAADKLTCLMRHSYACRSSPGHTLLEKCRLLAAAVPVPTDRKGLVD